MRSLNDTIARLTALRGRESSIAGFTAHDRLNDFNDFGSNPGSLRARYFVPDRLAEGAPLVVVLHGCTQDAASYDHGSGWSRLAEEQGFAVLFPEQTRANNPSLCFNWFNPQDTRRDGGEALSIRQMIAAMVADHQLDASRVYITGLSAGGGMTSVLLATYPEVFAGGAIIAGLPYGTANSVPEAFDRMRAHGGPASAALGDLVTGASSHSGQWPTISVWHGTSDTTVSPDNAALIIEQWRALHGVEGAASLSEDVSGHRRRAWRNVNGREVIEEYTIAGMGHGTPIATTGTDAGGVAGPYMLDTGISSTRRIAAFWGLAKSERKPMPLDSTENAPEAEQERPALQPKRKAATTQPQHVVPGMTRVIENALKAAGLMK